MEIGMQTLLFQNAVKNFAADKDEWVIFKSLSFLFFDKIFLQQFQNFVAA